MRGSIPEIKPRTIVSLNGIEMEVTDFTIAYDKLQDADWKLSPFTLYQPYGEVTGTINLRHLPPDLAHPKCKSTITPFTGKESNDMTNTSQKIKELSLDEDTRLLRKHNVINTEGDITGNGVDVLIDLLLEENRDKVVAKLKALDAAEAANSAK